METRKRKTSAGGQPEFPPFTKEHQRVIMLFFFRRGSNVRECHNELKNVIGDEAPCIRTVERWFARFSTGHFGVEDDPREGRPRTSTDEQSVAAVKAAIEEDPRLTGEKLEEMLGIEVTSVYRILHDHLGLSVKAARWVPRLLTQEQMDARVEFSRWFLEEFDEGRSPKFRFIVTGDEAWFHKSDPETKQQSMVWTKKGEAPPVKARREKSAGKIMLAIFFSHDGIVASVPLEQGKTVTSQWYVDNCLPKVFDKLQGGRPKSILKKHFLHHDNAPAHRASKTLLFIGASGIQLIEPPPYSPDLAPCDFWLFSKVKQPLRGKVFKTIDNVIEAVNTQLNQLKNEDFEQCFQSWIYRLKKCKDIGGKYVEKS